mmetsp:Transcript_214/g.555  ORF Transcript_214/g.555 Transcript_214/m.555 type:complete len:173 (-) Transcript_214:78-596(-)
MAKRIPSVEELEGFLVGELREFLEEHNVSVSSVPSSGKTPNRPTKKDLLARAIELQKQLRAGENLQEPENANRTAASRAPRSTPVMVRRKRAPVSPTTKVVSPRSPKTGRTSLDVSPDKKGSAETEAGNEEDGSIESFAHMLCSAVFLIVLLALFLGALLATRSGLAYDSKY